MTSHTEKECGWCYQLTRLDELKFMECEKCRSRLSRFKKNVKIEFSHQEEKIVFRPLGEIIMFMLYFATTCIMLYHMNEIKDPNPNNNVWNMFAFTFFFGFSVAMYVFITGVIIYWVFYTFKQKNQKGFWICLVVLLMFVSLSAVVFAYIKCVKAVNNLTIFWQTTLVMDVIVLFVFFIAILIHLEYDEQKSDIDTEEKKAAGTKSVKKVKPRNYASMADTKVLTEKIVINV